MLFRSLKSVPLPAQRSLLILLGSLLLTSSLFAQASTTEPVFPATTTNIVYLQSGQDSWLVGSDQGTLVLRHSIDGLKWFDSALDERRVHFAALRDISVLRTFGQEQVVVFVAQVNNHDGVFALVPRNGKLQLLSWTSLVGSVSGTITGSRHLAVGPGKVQSFVLLGNRLVVATWFAKSGQFSARSIDLPFAPQGLDVKIAYSDGLTRVLVWQPVGSGRIDYVLLSVGETSQDQYIGSSTIPGSDNILARVAGGVDGCSYVLIGNGNSIQISTIRNGTVSANQTFTLSAAIHHVLLSSEGKALVESQSATSHSLSLIDGDSQKPIQDFLAEDHLISLSSQGNQWEYGWLQASTNTIQTVRISASGSQVKGTAVAASLRWLYAAPDGWRSSTGLLPDSAVYICLTKLPGAAQ